MSKLIDLDAAINALGTIDCSDGVGISALKCDAVDDAITVIKELQTVDAVPVRHGRWKCADDLYENAVCSVCGWETSDPWTVIKILYKFCPNCGADMRKDVDDGKAD